MTMVFNELEIEDYFLKRLRVWREQRAGIQCNSLLHRFWNRLEERPKVTNDTNGPTSGETRDDSNTNSGTICRTKPLLFKLSITSDPSLALRLQGIPIRFLRLPQASATTTTTPQTRWVGLGRPPVVTSNPASPVIVLQGVDRA
ncbi:hypothetical protein OS493_000865 [Desmophyllum pertusum]|uniref:Uncharacterized protein n=1 Tax=Desmophyllum pertusum TaxID=174260 RepID=A0A9W9ZWZ6_9CNID|nr:hypothetical protein OS493_000865 [Desmophyllum pertusum]